MTRTLTLLLFCLLSVAAYADGFFRGAYWCTKAPEPGLRYAGALEMVFYDDLTLEADVYAGGSFIETVTAGYAETPKSFKFTFVDSDGWTYTGVMNRKTLLLTGTFKSTLGSYKGKFQCVFIETTPEGDQKSTTRKGEGERKSGRSFRGTLRP